MGGIPAPIPAPESRGKGKGKGKPSMTHANVSAIECHIARCAKQDPCQSIWNTSPIFHKREGTGPRPGPAQLRLRPSRNKGGRGCRFPRGQRALTMVRTTIKKYWNGFLE